MVRIRTLALALSLSVSPVWAAQIVQFSPQNRVSVVKSVKAVFDVPVIAFGNDQAPAPMDVVCDDPNVKGEGRWTDAKRWTYVFTSEPGPGVHCSASVKPSFRTLTDEALRGPSRFTFETGGPRVIWSRPYGPAIEEEQAFVLRFNVPVAVDSLLAHTSCQIQGLGEVVPVRLIAGAERTGILDAASVDESERDPATQVLQCKRRLPPDAKVRLNVQAGVATSSGVVSDAPEVFDYTVRPPFKASFSCQRENANAPCTPILPITLEFSAPISRSDAQKIRLKTPTQERSPSRDGTGPYPDSISHVQFDGPFPERAQLTLVLPEGLKDDAGRALSNADQFPLITQTSAFPPLVKFAAAPFGVIERFANQPSGGSEDDYPASVPLTVRSVEAALNATELPVPQSKVRDYAVMDDVDLLHWYARLQRLEDNNWTQPQLDAIMADKAIPSGNDKRPRIDARGFSALKTQSNTRQLVLPAAVKGDLRPFEVIGVPIKEPGFHVLEVESARLGQSLLASAAPMYVRTSALVTNLGVHIKRGRDDALAWVTTLDEGKVVPNAAIVVLSCSGELLARGMTDAQGIWRSRNALDAPDYCEDSGLSGIYVSARIPADHPLAHGKADFAFVFSDWNQGIESWRFNVPTDTSPKPTTIVNTVFDRTLFRAGETVSMKHFIRVQTRSGLGLPKDESRWPNRVLIQHEGSDQRYELPLTWIKTESGGLSASSRFSIPATAKLGMYRVELHNDQDEWFGASEFRVEEFKLPVLTGSLKISNEDGSSLLIAPSSLNADVQVSYVSGGPAGKLPVSISGVLRDKRLQFPNYDDYSFNAPDPSDDDESSQDSSTHDAQSLFLNKKSLVLDAQGGGRLTLDSVPVVTQAQDLVFETGFADPNGEIQTLSQTVPIWPSGVQAGIRTDSWVTKGQPTGISVVALSPAGQPQANAPVVVSAQSKVTYSTRKRLVGGFYSYDNHTETRDLGQVCQGTTDKRGVFACSVELKDSGSIQLRAQVKDKQGRASTAASTVWVMGADDIWFGGANDDRIDIIPEKKSYKPGETAHFQVRMPFRQATALVAVEREGVLATQVTTLSGKDPRVSIPIKAEWGPNVYVSVLVLRGRLRDVPWYSFFTWGWQQPRAWYEAYKNTSKEYAAPAAFVDLSKPAFRFGLTEIHVSDTRDQLVVKVHADKKTYQVRGKATVTVQVTLPDGKPAAHGQVAFAAVDQALLELSPNNSWNLLDAMRRPHGYGVETATAQMQIVGRRHYGRKALPAGGGGGKSPTRELLDTLLLWQPMVQLDQDGKAQITVALNDSITRFKLVAVADYGASRFGTGSTSIAVTQDLQVISGLPALVREGDRYQTGVTVRNSTSREMKLQVDARYEGVGVSGEALPSKTVQVAAGAAQRVTWDVEAPEGNLLERSAVLKWRIQAREQRPQNGLKEQDGAFDRLAVSQSLMPSIPITARQATLVSVDSDRSLISLPAAPPDGALLDADGHPRGGLEISLQSSLAGGLPGVKQWFAAYPYTCLEQLGSKAIGLRSPQQWQSVMAQLPDYLDADGLAAYFPGARYGSEVLTAYLLTASNEAQALGLPYALPDASKRAMTRGLLAFAQGKIVRYRPAPKKDLDARKLLVLEALSREGLVKARMLDSIAIEPNRWPTSAVIDWLAILQRVPGIVDRPARLKQARQILRARLLSRGAELTFADDADSGWWWLMVSPEVNDAKLMLTVMGQPEWADDMPRLAQGLLKLQRRGAWRTTTSNLMGSLALEKFAQHYERSPITGQTRVRFESGGQVRTVDWDALRKKAGTNNGVLSQRIFQPWGKAESDTLTIDQNGRGQGWASIRSLAAVPIVKPIMAGYQLTRKVTPVSQAVPGAWSRGDVLRVDIQIVSTTPTVWAVLTDPVPAGATILGSGLGRDSSIATQTKSDLAWRDRPSFVERKFDSYRAYYEYLPQGTTSVQYTVRLNTVGQFQLPATRVEAMYQPDVYGELPNLKGMTVQARMP